MRSFTATEAAKEIRGLAAGTIGNLIKDKSYEKIDSTREAIAQAVEASDQQFDGLVDAWRYGWEPIELAALQSGQEIRYTTAPVDYDGFGTTDRGVIGTTCGKDVRKVGLNPKHKDWQDMRYGSGMHCCHTQEGWDELVTLGLAELT